MLACMLVIEAVPNLAKGGELGPIKAEIDRIVGQLASEGVSREQLAHSVNAQRALRIWPLDSVAGKVEQLATGHTLFADPNFQYRNLQRIARVTPADLQRVLTRYVLNKPRVVLSVVPAEHPEWQAGRPNFVEPPPCRWPDRPPLCCRMSSRRPWTGARSRPVVAPCRCPCRHCGRPSWGSGSPCSVTTAMRCRPLP